MVSRQITMPVIDAMNKIIPLQNVNGKHKVEIIPAFDLLEINNDLTLRRGCLSNMLRFGNPSQLAVSAVPFFKTANNKSFLANNFTLPSFQTAAELGSAAMNSSDTALFDNSFNGVYSSILHRRPRGEKRPIPNEQKDEKYYERRKRNNEAAKKSRDARKIREDRIALRATLLEQENSLLRAQVYALREELHNIKNWSVCQ